MQYLRRVSRPCTTRSVVAVWRLLCTQAALCFPLSSSLTALAPHVLDYLGKGDYLLLLLHNWGNEIEDFWKFLLFDKHARLNQILLRRQERVTKNV